MRLVSGTFLFDVRTARIITEDAPHGPQERPRLRRRRLFRPEISALESRQLLAFDPKSALSINMLGLPQLTGPKPLDSSQAASVMRAVTSGSTSNPFGSVRVQGLTGSRAGVASSSLAANTSIVASAQTSHAWAGPSSSPSPTASLVPTISPAPLAPSYGQVPRPPGFIGPLPVVASSPAATVSPTAIAAKVKDDVASITTAGPTAGPISKPSASTPGPAAIRPYTGAVSNVAVQPAVVSSDAMSYATAEDMSSSGYTSGSDSSSDSGSGYTSGSDSSSPQPRAIAP